MNAPAPTIESLLSEGEAHIHAGRFMQAEACVADVLQQQPRNARAHYLRGLSAFFQRRPADGIASLEQALQADPANPQFHFVMGMCLAGAGRAEEAIESYRRTLQLRPRFFEALANLGNVYETHGRFVEAAECYRDALALRPDEPLLLNGLGVCEMSMGRHAQALPHLERAVALRANFDTAMNNLASCLGKTGRGAEAVEWLRRALALRPAFLEAWINLGEQLYIARRDAEAVESLDRALALDPSNDAVRYLRDAMAGVKVDRAPDAFVAHFFDRFAPDFERRLTEDLEYRTPQVAAERLAPWLATRGALRVVDLGCGTGLSGTFLRDKARELVGVDLSGGMLERARERGLYDRLEQSEIAAFLARCAAGSVDLAIALDVFVYVGNLEPIVRGCAEVLAPGGLFVFSVERLVEGDFALARTGRYAHSRAYVEGLAAAAQLRITDVHPTVIRKEDGAPVQGDLYTLARDAA